jgi:hypothetical protein
MAIALATPTAAIFVLGAERWARVVVVSGSPKAIVTSERERGINSCHSLIS